MMLSDPTSLSEKIPPETTVMQIGEQGQPLVIEYVTSAGNELSSGRFLDVKVMCLGGRERTESKYREQFKAAGFKLTKIIPTQMDVSIIEGVYDNYLNR